MIAFNDNDTLVEIGGKVTSMYGTCSTSSDTAEKAVTISNLSQIDTGATIRVKFTNANTATDPTLNVNNLGAKPIYTSGTASSGKLWEADSVVQLTYDGSAWMLISSGGGESSLAELTDTNIDNPTEAQPLTYDSVSGKWVNGGDSIPTAYGGTGNSWGYIRTGQLADTTVGRYATIEGSSNTGSGMYAHVEGGNNVASGRYTHAGGLDNTAAYDFQTTVGKHNNNKSGTLLEVGNGESNLAKSNAFEVYSDGKISCDDGTSKFKFTQVDGEDGYYDASGIFHSLAGLPSDPLTIDHGGTGNAEGYIRTGHNGGTTIGHAATIEGEKNEGSGHYSHVEGWLNSARGNYSHVGGHGNTADYADQTVIGKYNSIKDSTLLEIGNGVSSSSRSNALEVYNDGKVSWDNGATKFKFTQHNGEDGYYDASGTFHPFSSGIEDPLSTAHGGTGNTDGYIRTGTSSPAGTAATVEGTNNVGSGSNSHVEGSYNQTGANATNSHVSGYANVSSYANQTVVGVANNNKSDTYFEVGNGSKNGQHKNAFEVYSNGNATVQGNLTVGGSITNSNGTLNAVVANPSDTASTNLTKIKIGSTAYNISSGGGGLPSDPLSIDHGGTGNAAGYIRTGQKSGTTIGANATAEGYSNTASGSYAHAEGNVTTASSDNCHAEGYGTRAIASCCHAEGNGTLASGWQAHAEGADTTASGTFCAHAEGKYTTASGSYTHASGYRSTAGYDYQTVIGKWNNNKSSTLFEVGNGTSSSARSNAFEVYSNGNVVAGGSVSDSNGTLNAVVANPSDTASTDLTKIKIGSTAYNIPSGSGSGDTVSKKRYQLLATYWVSDSSTGYYKYDLTLNPTLKNCPNIYLAGGYNNTYPSDTTIGYYRNLKQCLYNGSTLTLYSAVRPTTTEAYCIWVEGIEGTTSNNYAGNIVPYNQDNDTHRPIKVNGTQILSNTSTTALNLKAGSNVTLSNSSGSVTINSSYTDTDTHRPIQVNGSEILGDNTTALNLKAGSNVTLSTNGGTVTINSSGGGGGGGLPSDPLTIDHGGTGNSDGYIQTGAASGTVKGDRATIEGYTNTATGSYAHAEGYNTTSNGQSSHAEGEGTQATVEYAHAEGYRSRARGSAAHSEGFQCIADGAYSHAQGKNTNALGEGSFAGGLRTSVKADYTFAFGYQQENIGGTFGYKPYTFVVGYQGSRYGNNPKEAYFGRGTKLQNGNADTVDAEYGAIWETASGGTTNIYIQGNSSMFLLSISMYKGQYNDLLASAIYYIAGSATGINNARALIELGRYGPADAFTVSVISYPNGTLAVTPGSSYTTNPYVGQVTRIL